MVADLARVPDAADFLELLAFFVVTAAFFVREGFVAVLPNKKGEERQKAARTSKDFINSE